MKSFFNIFKRQKKPSMKEENVKNKRIWHDGSHCMIPGYGSKYVYTIVKHETSANRFYLIPLDDDGSNKYPYTGETMDARFAHSHVVISHEMFENLKLELEKSKQTKVHTRDNQPCIAHTEYAIWVVGEPTANCQISSIHNFAGISDLKLDDRKKVLSELFAVDGQPMSIIDIEEHLESKVDEMFEAEDIIFKQPYTSTNNSSMIMYLVINTPFGYKGPDEDYEGYDDDDYSIDFSDD